MSLQSFTTGRMPGLSKVVTMLRFLEVVHGTMAPIAPCVPKRVTTPSPTHSSKAHFPQHL
jgi:hypothetical protein